MENSGRILAFDLSAKRLRPLAARAGRAGVSIIEPHGLKDPVARAAIGELSAKADRVLVDAPCSGTGTWRRAPDARWKLTPDRLAEYCQIQSEVLREAAALVRPGGRLVYVTCSVLRRENTDQVVSFLRDRPDFISRPTREVLSADLPSASTVEVGTMLTPHSAGTDGFFIAVLERSGE